MNDDQILKPEYYDHYFKQILEMFDNEYNRELYNKIISVALFCPTPVMRLKSAIDIVISDFVPEIDKLLEMAERNGEDRTPYLETIKNYSEFREQVFDFQRQLNQVISNG